MAHSLNEPFLSLSNLKNEAKGLYNISTIIKLFSTYIYNIVLGTVSSAKRNVIKEKIIFEQLEGVRHCVSYQKCTDR